MKKFKNGWCVPVDDQRMSHHLENDVDMLNPTYEGKYRTHILEHLPNRRTFIDVGANVGVWSLPFVKQFKKVVGYEPSRQNIECLRHNVGDLMEIRTKAVANFEGTADFRQGGKNCGDGKLSRPGARVDYTVPVVKLDNENLMDVDLIKIDVQGWELEVLQGAMDLIKQQKPWVVFEVNQDIDVCCTLMEHIGYETIRLKSKRLFCWAPVSGHNSPHDRTQFGRYLGPGPYAARFGGK
jgi:FkbM family methyltransferase